LLAPALLPLVYVDGLLYPYVAPKTLLFRALFIVAAAAFAYLALSGHTFYWKRLSPKSTENGSLYFFFAWTPAVLLVVAYATSLLGIDFYHSFWSIFDRGDGLLTLTAAVGFFYLILLYADKEFLRKLFSVAAWVGSLVAVYAVLQWLQSVSGMNIPVIAEPRGRFGATFGNAAFLAAYLGMTLFASLAVLSEYRGRWLRALQIGAGLQLLAIILAATRGTLLALFMAGVLAAVYLALKGGSSTSFGKDQDKSLGASGRMHTYARGGLLVAVVLAGLFFMFRSPLSESSFEPVRRIASISLNDVTVSSRLFVWKNVFEEAKLKPLTGYGAEHVDVLFNRVYDPGDILEEWFDRSHNAYLDYFVQYGILGVLLYTGIIAGLGWSGWRLSRLERMAPLQKGSLRKTQRTVLCVFQGLRPICSADGTRIRPTKLLCVRHSDDALVLVCNTCRCACVRRHGSPYQHFPLPALPSMGMLEGCRKQSPWPWESRFLRSCIRLQSSLCARISRSRKDTSIMSSTWTAR